MNKNNTEEKKKVIMELSGRLGKKAFEDLYDTAVSKPFGFLSINFDALELKYQYTANFKDIILTDEHINNREKLFK